MCDNPSVYFWKLLSLEDRVIQGKSRNGRNKASFLVKLESEVENGCLTFFQDITQFHQIHAGLETLVDSS